MGANYSEIQELLQQKADIQARLNLMPYDGNPEIKESNGSKYLYMRKRVAGKLTSTYVDVYSDELYQLLLRNAKERKDLNKAIRKINKDLAALGYEDKELSARVLQNLDFARANLKTNIYDQAVLEGVATTFPQTEDIIENGHALAATDFDRAFTVFHGIFFPGKENWLFDPATDPVILLLPEEFFRNCAIAIAASLLLLCLVLILTGRRQKK